MAIGRTFQIHFLVLKTIHFFLTVVALDGTLIAKNGNVTGGVSSGMEAKSKRWDDKAVEGELLSTLDIANQLVEMQKQNFHSLKLISLGASLEMDPPLIFHLLKKVVRQRLPAGTLYRCPKLSQGLEPSRRKSVER